MPSLPAFTECDHVFDGTQPRGHFSLPILPNSAKFVRGHHVRLPNNIQVMT